MIGQLPRGITGFYSAYPGAAPPNVAVTSFKTTCYTVLREVDGRVVNIQSTGEQGTITNYHMAQVIHNQETVYILCNAHYPYLAFTREVRLELTEYIDLPELQQGFEETGVFIPLPGAYLHQYPEPGLLVTLDEAEKDQIKYWQPKQLGDLIFNRWD